MHSEKARHSYKVIQLIPSHLNHKKLYDRLRIAQGYWYSFRCVYMCVSVCVDKYTFSWYNAVIISFPKKVIHCWFISLRSLSCWSSVLVIWPACSRVAIERPFSLALLSVAPWSVLHRTLRGNIHYKHQALSTCSLSNLQGVWGHNHIPVCNQTTPTSHDSVVPCVLVPTCYPLLTHHTMPASEHTPHQQHCMVC